MGEYFAIFAFFMSTYAHIWENYRIFAKEETNLK